MKHDFLPSTRYVICEQSSNKCDIFCQTKNKNHNFTIKIKSYLLKITQMFFILHTQSTFFVLKGQYRTFQQILKAFGDVKIL